MVNLEYFLSKHVISQRYRPMVMVIMLFSAKVLHERDKVDYFWSYGTNAIWLIRKGIQHHLYLYGTFPFHLPFKGKCFVWSALPAGPALFHLCFFCCSLSLCVAYAKRYPKWVETSFGDLGHDPSRLH